ncbi:MAG: hypothetical protein AB2L14_01755 [Candidatus Xenobiia bacterium LiM19]
MTIEIYDLLPQDGEYVLDRSSHVATIRVEGGIGTFSFSSTDKEQLIRELFEGPAVAFDPEHVIVTDGSRYADVIREYPAWSREAILQVVNDDLPGFFLGAVISED